MEKLIAPILHGSALNRDEAVPLFYQLVNVLRQEIARMENGSQLTPERELAVRYGVSRFTVTRAINQLIDEGYIYRIQGKGTFVLGKSKGTKHSVLLVIPHPIRYYINHSNVTFAELLQGVMDEANKTGNIMIFHVPNGVDETEYCIEKMTESGAEGIILLALKNLNHILSIAKREKLPHVLLNVKNQGYDKQNNVLAKERDGVAKAVRYLAGQGHRRIAYLRARTEMPPVVDRFEGYQQGLESSGLVYDESLVKYMKYADSIEGSVEEIKNFFCMPEPPTAIVAACDAYAIQTMYLLQSMGMKIPGDVSVTGFDDIPEAATFKPALTTIRKPGYEMGQESVRYLVELIDSGFSVQGPRFFDTELIIRESCSAPL